ncbi:XRE family transcriptional regulator [Sinirhodobacter sp. WL0062]|uniref:XRE family transcriptional regulator n=1 Tax=Rhodobacter flavimaris TaxID=2907145 RepID=A0ABS8YY55_9RHOB|nr:XRE family transcriptional regulator [Sinirhodobacter sp. WL0062]MCE5973429.1 XRE family transcriptional regulator [Sinirhodobacter sp. WL0062]
MKKKPYEDSPAAEFIAERVRDLKHKKSQGDIAHEVGFVNSNMMSLLKSGANKVPLDRVPALAKALEADPAVLMRLALEQSVGVTAATAIVEVFGTPVSENERGWLDEIRKASGNGDPRLTARSRTTLRSIFGL